MLVGEVHCAANRSKDADALSQIQISLITVMIQKFAFNVFHYKIRSPFFRITGILLDLAAKPPEYFFGIHTLPEHLDSYQLLVITGSHGKIDIPHSTPAQAFLDPVMPQGLTYKGVRGSGSWYLGFDAER
jgi:hypothetical protein